MTNRMLVRLTSLLAAACTLAFATQAMACPVCFGDKDSDLTKGAASGVLFMVLTTYCLLLGVCGMVTFWLVRARRMRLAGGAGVVPGGESSDRAAHG